MDRNTVTGLILIALIIITFTYFFREEPKKTEAVRTPSSSGQIQAPQSPVPNDSQKVQLSSAKTDSGHVNSNLPGEWQNFGHGSNSSVVLENKKLKLVISSKGGRISFAELKDYKTFDKKPVVLADSISASYAYRFTTGSQAISTSDLYFTPDSVTPASVVMVLNLGGGRQIRQAYRLNDDSYLIGHRLDLIGFDQIIPKKESYIDVVWNAKAIQHEQDSDIARNNTTIYYHNTGASPGYLTETKDANEKFKKETDWVSFKQQFFCQTLITHQPFTILDLTSQRIAEPRYLKQLSAVMTLPYDHTPRQSYGMEFYMGPLHYKTLKNVGSELEHQIPLGWGIFGWINRFLIIPTFNLLSSFIGNFGIIIFILTVIIKLITFPFTYKSYLSTAKMRILKPELDEIKAKYGNDLARQQSEQMKLYRRAGVSPLGGCLPMVLQLPILIAMFRFFPSSIELRGQSFLWAHDLSTYDNILPYLFHIERLPFKIPAYGDHVSLWTLLMTISTIIYTWMNNTVSSQPKEYKWMSYLMPIFFLGFFNNYSAGLSIYYFFFNVLTFGQQYLFKLFMDEKKLLAQIEENRRKPQAQKKKSSFQKRLEEMAKRQQEMQRRRR